MSFTDIFTDEFLKGFNTDISIYTITMVLSISLVMGLFIYLVYRLKTKNAFYNKDFNNTLIALPIITSAIVLSMQANIVVSLGMVGALSIVRFRNAVKSSMDLMYLFWAISIGIINGAQVYLLSTLLTMLMTVVVMVVDLFNAKSKSLLVVVSLSDTNKKELNSLIKSFDSKAIIRSEAKSNNKYQVIYELSTSKRNELANKLYSLSNVDSMNIILNDGANRLV